MNASVQSNALYAGSIRHRRYLPKPHAFRYGLFQVYLDTRHIERTLQAFWFCSIRRFNWLQYRRSDYFGSADLPLDEAVRRHVEDRTGRRPTGPVFLLTHLRVFGFAINPVSFYYGFDDSGSQLEWILAEITNTPWGERHSYFLPVDQSMPGQGPLQWRFGELTASALLAQLMRYPFITAKVAFAIYWQALRLWIKGVPFFNHPGRSV